MELNLEEYSLIQKVSSITTSDYCEWFDDEKNIGHIECKELIYAIEDLLDEIDYQKDKYKELKEKYEEEHQEPNFYRLTGVRESDFH